MNNAITWETIDQSTRLSIRDLARSTIETIRRLLSIGREKADTSTATRVLIEIAIDEMIRTGASEEHVLEMLAQALHGAQGRTATGDHQMRTSTPGTDAVADTKISNRNQSQHFEDQAQSGSGKSGSDTDVSGGGPDAANAGSSVSAKDGVAWSDVDKGRAQAAGKSWDDGSQTQSEPKIEVASGAQPGYPYRVQLVSPEGDVVKVLSVRGGEQDIAEWLRRNIHKFPGYGWKLINPSGVLIASEDPL